MVSPSRPDSQTVSEPRPVVELLTKPACHLCADALAVVASVCGELGMPWQEVSTVDAPELLERFAEEIPVLLIDGVQRDFWKIDESRLRRLLTR